MGLQFDSLPRREEFRELRRSAIRSPDGVEEMLEALSRCCPPLRPSIRQQLEAEYGVALPGAAESPIRTHVVNEASPTCAVVEPTAASATATATATAVGPAHPVKHASRRPLPKAGTRRASSLVRGSHSWGIVMP
jgi:hypothetical protein